MLYVFRVDTGTMLQLEMNLALETVRELKDAIERTCRIPPAKQVLLVSGGECLELTTRVCSYSAGTDTNPIFLFSKNSPDARSLSPSADYGSDGEITEQVEASLDLPSTYSTLVARATLAQNLSDLGKELARDCERLIHDQHLQQQGWAAAVANLEDMAAFFRERSAAFQKDYRAHLQIREENLTVLKNFNEDLLTLARIPILPPLLASAISLSGLELDTKVTAMTLLEWISAKDNQSSLQAVAEQCTSFLEQLNETVLDEMMKNVESALELAEKTDMKEIKGLSERLCGLEQLMQRARRIVQDQTEFAQSFQQNQLRASNIGDASVLHPLCTSHRRQLLVMLENQTKLKDIRRRCFKAKEELSENLHHRLRWVAYAQNEMLMVGNNLLIYQESLKRGRRHFLIVRQVQRAPEMYCLAVAEVVRRRTFSRAYLSWSKDLSNRLLATYNEESERRREFKEQFGGHFLEALFPGLDDEPSSFATTAPEPFDTLLPDLTADDMEKLRETLPELALRVSWTELSSVAQMILSKNQPEIKEVGKEDLAVEERLVAAVEQIGLADKMDETLLRQDDSLKTKDDRDLESETDTDEFEKVSQSPLDKKMDLSDPQKRLTDSMRQQISDVARVSIEATTLLRAELIELQGQTAASKDDILCLAKEIQLHVAQLTEGYVSELAEMHTRLKFTENETQTKTDEIQQLIQEKNEAVAEETIRVEKLRALLDATTEENNQTVAKLKQEIEELRQKHVTELEKIDAEKKEMKETFHQLSTKLEENSSQKLAEVTKTFEAQLENLRVKESQLVNNFLTKEEEFRKKIERYEEEKTELTDRLVQAELTCEVELENRGRELEAEHGKALAELEERLKEAHQLEIAEVTERVTNDFKSELANLRGRFRFMSVDKSPSDLSLEKVERGDVIELANHEAILEQTKEDAQEALEKAVVEAVEAEKQRSRQHIEEELAAARLRMEEEKQFWLDEAVNRALAERERKVEEELKAKLDAVTATAADRERQVEALSLKQQSLLTENQRHRDTIRLLSEGENRRSGAGTVDPLLEIIEKLEKERKELLEEVTRLRDCSQRRRLTSIDECEDLEMSDSAYGGGDDMTLSVITDSNSSPETSRRELKMTKSLPASRTNISIGSCGPDDLVIVVWNSELANYAILQESPTWYLLHSSCLDTLGLRPSSDGSPRKYYSLAIVINKEYCNAKKAENRYRLPKGTKFYRVLVKPVGIDRLTSSLIRYPTDSGLSS